MTVQALLIFALYTISGIFTLKFLKRHGFRIEVRLPEECDEPLAGTLRFTATAACRAAAA